MRHLQAWALGLLVALPAAPLAAKERASFLAGTYATEDGCRKLARIHAGGPRNLETVPWTLEADGFHGWEGACEFTRIDEHEPGRSWIAIMMCVEGAQLAPELYLFMKDEAEDAFEVARQGDDSPELYRRCGAGKGR